jgi:hypothetical protein
MNIIDEIFNTPLKAIKGSLAYDSFKKKDIYITEINENMKLCLSNLSPKQRENEEYRDLHENCSAWHDEEELIISKP